VKKNKAQNMASFPFNMVDRKQKSNLKSMMKRKSLSPEDALLVKEMMIREAVNIQVTEKVGDNIADVKTIASRDVGGKDLKSMLKRKSLSSKDALLIREMMIKEAQKNKNTEVNINNIVGTTNSNSDISNNKRNSDRNNNNTDAIQCTSNTPPSFFKKREKQNSNRRSSKVLFDYTSQEVDEIDISVGEVVEIIEKQSDGWYRVRKTSNAEEGLVPGNYLKEHDIIVNKNESEKTISANSLLHKKSLSASESDDIRRMMTMLAGKSDTNSTVDHNNDNNDSNGINPFAKLLTPNSKTSNDNLNNGRNTNKNYEGNKTNEDNLLRHVIDYWSITKGEWVVVDVALDTKMGVIFVRIPDIENVLTIQISSISAVDVDVDPASTMNAATSFGSINNKFCFRVTEREDEFYVFATSKLPCNI
jgi:hypothetical protein